MHRGVAPFATVYSDLQLPGKLTAHSWVCRVPVVRSDHQHHRRELSRCQSTRTCRQEKSGVTIVAFASAKIVAKDERRSPAAASNAAAGNLSADSLKAHIDRLRSPLHEKANTPVSISRNEAPSVLRDRVPRSGHTRFPAGQARHPRRDECRARTPNEALPWRLRSRLNVSGFSKTSSSRFADAVTHRHGGPGRNRATADFDVVARNPEQDLYRPICERRVSSIASGTRPRSARTRS